MHELEAALPVAVLMAISPKQELRSHVLTCDTTPLRV